MAFRGGRRRLALRRPPPRGAQRRHSRSEIRIRETTARPNVGVDPRWSALTLDFPRLSIAHRTTRETWNSTTGPGWMRPCPTKMLWLTQAYLGSPDSRRGVVTK